MKWPFFIKNPFSNQEKNILFSFELREKVLENNKNSGKIKIQNFCEPFVNW